MTDLREPPRYYGIEKYSAEEAGYAIWLPTGWHRVDMTEGHRGVIFYSRLDDSNTFFLAEKHNLKYAVTEEDVPILRQGFSDGLMKISGIQVEWQNETVTPTLITLEARFTFLDGKDRQKRWLRNIYWLKGQLILIAQGANIMEFQYWLPMFSNIMLTVEIY